MKKLTKIYAIGLLVLILITSSAFAQHRSGGSKGITESGFFAHLGGIIPSKNYFFPPDIDNDTDIKFGFGPCLDIGHMFRIVDLDGMAFGIRPTWVSTFYTKLKIDDTLSLDAIQVSILKVGPYFTFGLSDDAAIDIYYQIAPAVLVELNDGITFLGATHSFGFGFRYSILSIGIDYNLGNLKDVEAPKSASPGIMGLYKVRTNHIRFFVGIKI